ncbi:Uncharacterized protein APZ42_031643 [Daphnia magna]|uniref:Uncharacterized protein n=1 Tax=Daphnia magna TaxID=35525 RepID=A0A162DB12_9CRUS|nr:Uncharacterized protein APZ42_031643 [Daphnia magna]
MRVQKYKKWVHSGKHQPKNCRNYHKHLRHRPLDGSTRTHRVLGLLITSSTLSLPLLFS